MEYVIEIRNATTDFYHFYYFDNTLSYLYKIDLFSLTSVDRKTVRRRTAG